MHKNKKIKNWEKKYGITFKNNIINMRLAPKIPFIYLSLNFFNVLKLYDRSVISIYLPAARGRSA